MGPPKPGSGKATVEFINTAPCAVKVNPDLFYEVNLGYGEVGFLFEILSI